MLRADWRIFDNADNIKTGYDEGINSMDLWHDRTHTPRWLLMLLAVGLLFAIACLVRGDGGAIVPTPEAGMEITAATMVPQTESLVYIPDWSETTPRAGQCYSNSQIVPSRAAWRCEVGEQSWDPCFLLDGGVVCGGDPLSNEPAFPLTLESPLPEPEAPVLPTDTPWLIQLADQSLCGLALGETKTIDGEPVRYHCRDEAGSVVVGDLQPGESWQARVADPAGEVLLWRRVETIWRYGNIRDTLAELKGPATQVIDYVPRLPEGEPRSGSCWTGSVSVPGKISWRCTVDGEIFDPCFTAPEAGLVICGADPLTGESGFAVGLNEPLPQPGPLLSGSTHQPWLVVLSDGTRCSQATGATGSVKDLRINYICEGEKRTAEGEEVVLAGDIYSGTIWGAQKAVLDFTDDGMKVKSLEVTPLSQVVWGPLTFSPLPYEGLVQDLQDLLGGQAFSIEGAFRDLATGERGVARRIQLDGTSRELKNGDEVALAVQNLLGMQGWQAESVEGPVLDFRRPGAVCQGLVAWAAGPRHFDLTLECARDLASGELFRPFEHEAERISFEPGGSSAEVSAEIQPGEIRDYVIRVLSGQLLLADAALEDSETGLQLSLTGAWDDVVLAQCVPGVPGWKGRLGRNQDYRLRVVAPLKGGPFKLHVTVPRDIVLKSEEPTVLEGWATAGGRVHYLLEGHAGDMITLTVAAPENGAILAIFDLESNAPVLEESMAAQSWSGTFPEAGAYVVQVIAPGSETSFTLTVESQN